MYGVVLMMALTGAGQGTGCCVVNGYAGGIGCGAWGWGWGWGTPPGMGYGRLVSPVNTCCGVVLPPAPASDLTTKEEAQTWDEYVALLEGHEKAEMIQVWQKATVEGRRKLLEKLAAMRKQVEEETEKEEAGEPLTAEEMKKWEDYVKTLKGERKKEMEEKWQKANNKGKRQILEKIDPDEVHARPSRRQVAAQQ
jgi:hypothetical protein